MKPISHLLGALLLAACSATSALAVPVSDVNLTSWSMAGSEAQSLASTSATNDEWQQHKRLTLRPTFLFSGLGVGLEQSLSRKWAWHNELVAYGWSDDMAQMLMFDTNIKYYLAGNVSKGIYLRGTALFALILTDRVFDGQRLVGGGGFGLGAVMPFRKGSPWHFGIDLGYKIVSAYPEEVDGGPQSFSPEYEFFSPVSLLDWGVSVSYRF